MPQFGDLNKLHPTLIINPVLSQCCILAVLALIWDISDYVFFVNYLMNKDECIYHSWMLSEPTNFCSQSSCIFRTNRIEVWVPSHFCDQENSSPGPIPYLGLKTAIVLVLSHDRDQSDMSAGPKWQKLVKKPDIRSTSLINWYIVPLHSTPHTQTTSE